MLVQPIPTRLRARPLQALPVAQMVMGKPVEEAAALLPRIFNLCRVAQGIAARAAFGVPQEPGWQEALRLEIVKEHALKLCLKWPGQLCVPQLALPRDWQSGGDSLRIALFGPSRGMPDDMDQFEAFLVKDVGIAPVLQAIGHLFPPATAVRKGLPLTTADNIFDDCAQENSVAGRQVEHPVMAAIAARWGRGPLWSAAGVAYDLEACLNECLPLANLRPGRSIVPAARGLYGVRAAVEEGKVKAFHRVTPTDHLVMQDGMLDQSLATLDPASAPALSHALLSILDPCFPVTLEPDHIGGSVHA